MVGGKHQPAERLVSMEMTGGNHLESGFAENETRERLKKDDLPSGSHLFSDLPENITESNHWAEVDHAVKIALALDSPEADKFLKSMAASKPELYREVIWFLGAQDGLNGFMEVPAAEKLSDYLAEQVRISSFKTPQGELRILDLLGEGGMGQVYLVEHQGCLNRRVALKILREGVEEKDYRARFENEVRLLAHLNHPHISHVYEAGETLDGRPFFTMEFVPGLPLNQFCRQHKLGLKDRLELFLQICSGVAYAHSRGVIHRDLKPSNILVSMCEDRPVAKIIDFGIAKSMSAGYTANNLHTRMDQVLGTPIYMSPEQIAVVSGNDIDPRSDVYVLGALLYELLTGFPAKNQDDLSELSMGEALRQIADAEPGSPSKRIKQSATTHITSEYGVAACKKDLAKRLKGDLDLIVMKAMARNRKHRYDSVTKLSEDIQAHLEYRALAGFEPKLAYRIKKLCLRKRSEIMAAVGTLLSLLILVLLSMVFQRGVSKKIKGHVVEPINPLLNSEKAIFERPLQSDAFPQLILSLEIKKASSQD